MPRRRENRDRDKPKTFDIDSLLDNLTSGSIEKLTIDEKKILAQQLSVVSVFKGFFAQLAPKMQAAIEVMDLEDLAASNPQGFIRLMKDWGSLMVSILDMERKVAGLSDPETIVSVKNETHMKAQVDLSRLSDEELMQMLTEQTTEDLTNEYMDDLKS